MAIGYLGALEGTLRELGGVVLRRRRGDLVVVFTVSAVEAFEAALVLIALIPKGYLSALTGTLIAAIAVVALTVALKDQISRIRLPHLKYVLSALLFSLGTLWAVEIFMPISDLFLLAFFFIYLTVNYGLLKI